MQYAKDFKELARVNTGSHFLDSGGVYGRRWEKGAIPNDMPLEYAHGDMLLISTAVLLDEYLEIDQQETHRFRWWDRLVDPKDSSGMSWPQVCDLYVERMIESGRWKAQEGLMRDNTWNHETDLDQDFQFVSPGLYANYHLIQMHNGADVRGGYTAPVVAKGDLEDVLCSMQIRPYCRLCDSDPGNLYEAEKKGWRTRENKRSVSLVCGECHKVAARFPKVGK